MKILSCDVKKIEMNVLRDGLVSQNSIRFLILTDKI